MAPFNGLRDPFEELVEAELVKATAHHGPMASAHEAHSVILEEFEEWWDEVKANRHVEGLAELIQLAAMVRRAARDVYEAEVNRRFQDYLT